MARNTAKHPPASAYCPKTCIIALVADIVSTFHVQRMYPHQQLDVVRPERFKASLWGRRAGKSRMAYTTAIMGHGPVGEDGEPKWRGIRHGFDVLWIGRSHEQASQIWDEEVAPRFRAAFGNDSVNHTLKRATFPNGGHLIVTSQDREAIKNARGKGARIIGIIGDEVCHWDDAEDVWLSVLNPMLADNFGWAWFISTSEPGSWFNSLIDEIEEEKRAGWYFSERTALDNPRITREAFDAMVAEYRPDDPRLAKEVYAKRFAAGAGLAFPEWRKSVHVLPATSEVPKYWRYFAGLDWGRSAPGCFVLLGAGAEDNVVVKWDYRFQEMNAYDVGYIVGTRMLELGIPEWIGYDNQMNTAQDAMTKKEQGLSIIDKFAKGLNDAAPQFNVPLIPWPKGPNSRVNGKNIVHDYLAWKPNPTSDGTPLDWGWPRLRFHPNAAYCVSTIGRLMKDELNTEDVAQLDDHAYEALRGALVLRAPVADKPRHDIPDDVHPGFRADGKRRSRERTLEVEVEEETVALAMAGSLQTGRYGSRY